MHIVDYFKQTVYFFNPIIDIGFVCGNKTIFLINFHYPQSVCFMYKTVLKAKRDMVIFLFLSGKSL